MDSDRDRHAALIEEQFTLQATGFARSAALHSDAALTLLVEAGAPTRSDTMLDVACGPGSVVAAFAPLVQSAVGLDATEAMLDQARQLAAEKCIANVSWEQGDLYALPYGNAAFDIVTSRFAFHHLEDPERAFREMLRVCRPGGRVVVCDGVASADPVKARAFNAMECFRDPSTVAFRTAAYLTDLFAQRLAAPEVRFYFHRASMQRLLQNSFPLDGDRERLRALLEASVEGNQFDMNSRWQDGDVLLDCPVLILSARKPN